MVFASDIHAKTNFLITNGNASKDMSSTLKEQSSKGIEVATYSPH